MNRELLLKINAMSKSFGTTKAIKEVTVELYKGEVRALLGENGSGKSTLMNMVAGLLQPDAGSMELAGNAYAPKNVVEANRCGVNMIVQEMSTVEGLTVAENLFLGNEGEITRLGICNKPLMHAKAKEILHSFGLSDIDVDLDVGHFPFEQRKLIELAKAVYAHPQLLIIDETTTALSQNGRDKLYQVIRDMRGDGRTVIFISHDLSEVLQLADSITVFRDGSYIDTIGSVCATEDKLKSLMVGRELTGKYYREDYDGACTGEEVLRAQGVHCADSGLADISFALRKGEIMGIGGLTDSGMHELGQVLFGAQKVDSGEVKLTAAGKNIRTIRDAIGGGVAYVSKNRDEEALFTQDSINNNISIVSLRKFSKPLRLRPRAEREFTTKHANAMQVKMASIHQHVSALSGGNKQKVALAKWIGKDSDIYILDCPTRGIDVMVKASIYDLLSRLKEQGKSIILISEEILELIGMSDRILIIKNGRVSGELHRSRELSEEDVIQYMI